MSTVKTIDREELKKKIDRGDHFRLVETLSEEKFEKGHLPGAVNLLPDQVRNTAPRLLPDPSEEIILYCAGPT